MGSLAILIRFFLGIKCIDFQKINANFVCAKLFVSMIKLDIDDYVNLKIKFNKLDQYELH